MSESLEQDEATGSRQQFVKTGIACDRVRQMTKQCIKESECVQLKRSKARDCLGDADLPDKCLQLYYTLTECRRNMIDPRARFRGRKGDI